MTSLSTTYKTGKHINQVITATKLHKISNMEIVFITG